MAIVGCTKKLLTELKEKPSEIKQIPSELNSWHANMLRTDRRKCVLFTHDKTLYSLFIPSLLKNHFQNIREVFRQRLFKSLLSENLAQKHIELLLEDFSEMEITKTNNRSVLGSMNDLTFQLKFVIARNGGLMNTDIMELNHNLNRIPMMAIVEAYSIDALKNLLKSQKKRHQIQQDAKGAY